MNSQIIEAIPPIRKGEVITGDWCTSVSNAIRKLNGAAGRPSQVFKGAAGGGDDAMVFAVGAATKAAMTQSGLTVDGIVLDDGELLLDKDNATAGDRGLYYARSGTWDIADEDAKIVLGSLISVYDGVTNNDTLWIYTATNTFAQINAPSTIVVKAKAASATLSGTQTVDTISCAAGSLVLLTNTNTVYEVAATWIPRYVQPKCVFVTSGSANGPLIFGWNGTSYIGSGGVFT